MDNTINLKEKHQFLPEIIDKDNITGLCVCGLPQDNPLHIPMKQKIEGGRKMDELDEKSLLLLFDAWVYNMERKANKKIEKKVVLRRKFELHNGFSKVICSEMKDMTKGDLMEIRRLWKMKLPDVQPVRVFEEPTDMMMLTRHLEFTLHHSFVKETDKKIEMDLIYKQDL